MGWTSWHGSCDWLSLLYAVLAGCWLYGNGGNMRGSATWLLCKPTDVVALGDVLGACQTNWIYLGNR